MRDVQDDVNQPAASQGQQPRLEDKRQISGSSCGKFWTRHFRPISRF